MVVSGGATSTPLVAPGMRGTGAYAAMLAGLLPREAPPRCGMRLAEFFCCAGGIGLGFRSAGFELAFANDISPRAAESYALNLGHAPVVGDIRGVGADHYGALGEVDVVTGGFPCVTFSTAGRRMGVVDDLNGKLYQELCRVVREIRPRYFVAENVEGMLSANGGKAIKIVLAEFLRMGYRTAYELVNMAEHGVPQTRKRVIFVGVRLDQWRGSFVFPRRTHRLREDRRASRLLPIAVSLAEAIGDLPPPGERLGGQVYADAAAKAKRRAADDWVGSGYQNAKPRRPGQPSLSMISNGPAMLVVNHEENRAPVSETHAMSKRLARGARPSPTIVSEAANVQPFIVASRNADVHNPRRSARGPSVVATSSAPPGVTMSDGGLRRMTVRECARVQSFPDWYRFAGSQGDGYTVVGNAVPPLYARRLAMAIRDYDAREIIR